MIEPLGLLGGWDFDREIDDRHGAVQLHVAGTTHLNLDVDAQDHASRHDAPITRRVRWHENGTLTWPGGTSPVSRTLFIEQRRAGWFVTFDDGRDFHPWTPGKPVTHPCGTDLYRGTVTLLGPDAWYVEWLVTGPQKDYTMRTHLARAGDV